MNNRDRSSSPGSAISGGSGNLRFMVLVDASPAGHKATDFGRKECRGRGSPGWPKLLFVTGSLEMMEDGLFLDHGRLGSRSVNGGLCGLVSG